MEKYTQNSISEASASKEPKPPYETPLVMPLGSISIGVGKSCTKPGSTADSNCNNGSNAAGTQCHSGSNAPGDKCHTGSTAVGGECNGGSTAGTTCGSGTSANFS
jgi:hypothetical protein